MVFSQWFLGGRSGEVGFLEKVGWCVCVCVCVCVELLKRSKTCISTTLAIFWQYMNLFRGAALTSGLSHVHLFIFLVLAEKALSILQYNFSRGCKQLIQSCTNEDTECSW